MVTATSLRKHLGSFVRPAAVYGSVVLVALAINAVRLRLLSQAQTAAMRQYESTGLPFFSLSTHTTFAPGEYAKVWVDYQNVDHLDFRVYRINDPIKFFKQLDDPHQMGNRDKAEVSSNYSNRPSVLERTHSLKSYLYGAIKDYVREHLQKDHREKFNQKFRPANERIRTPLSVADYARVPLLNSDQLTSAWREKLPPMENQYDRRMISLGKREPGVYLVEAVNGDLRAYSLAVVTILAMVQKTTQKGDVLVYVVDRHTGAPHDGVTVEVTRGLNSLASGMTDKAGIFKADVSTVKGNETSAAPEDIDPEEQKARDTFLIMARERDNFVVSDLDWLNFSEFGYYDGYDSTLASYIYSDRPVYRPAQKVYFKGILRRRGKNGYELLASKTANVIVEDAEQGKIFERELPLSAHGTFSGDLQIPDEAPLGNYQIKAEAEGSKTSSYFEVQEYKKPEFKVRVTGPTQFAAVGEKVTFSVDARFFFGAPVANADVHYYIFRSRYFHWWLESDSSEEFDDGAGIDDARADENDYGYYGNDMVQEDDGKLDSRGHLPIQFQVPETNEKDQWDYSYTIEAQVTDSSRREMQGSASFVGTRGRVIADARPEHYIYYAGDTAKIRVKTSDYAGKAVAEKVTLKFIEQHWERIEKEEENNGYKYKSYDYISHESELSRAEVTTNSQGVASFDYSISSPGYIYISAIIKENGREIVNRGGEMWAPDRKGEWSDFDYRYAEQDEIKLVPDKKSYRPGETAHVLAMLPVEKTHLLVTVEQADVMSARQVDAPGRSLVIDVPIERRYEPNVYLNLAFVKDDDMFEQSQLMAVPARDRMLKLDILPNRKEYKPRDAASYTILARNYDGSPASNTEVSLGVVDEAIYSIQPETAGNIKREFYGRRYNQVQTRLAIHYSFTGYSGDQPIDLAKTRSAYQLADFKNDSSLTEPTIRREFKDTAFWQPDVITGADGRATVKFKLPDNLTTWRATARAITADTRVGSAVEKVLARKDVIMRLEMPRFLTEGDTVTISGVVHNFLKQQKTTRISLDLAGAQLLSASSETVTIPRNGEHRVDWRVTAAQPGEMRLLAKALTDKESDAVEMTIEIVPHGLKQTLGDSLALTQNDGEQTVSLDLPAHPDIQARKLRIEASPSIGGTLFRALDYLTTFPYGCTEQTMSGFLPNVIVADTLKKVDTSRIRASNDLPRKVQRGLDRLYSYQHDDGGWGWWKNDTTDPFMTAYVVDGLTLARRSGFEIEDWRLARAREKVVALLEANKSDDSNPIDAETRAYMIYAITESGATESSYIEELYGKRDQLQPYGRALLALALKHRADDRALEIAAEIESSAHVNEFDAHWETNRLNHYGREVRLDVETTALSLKALSQISSRSPLLSKAARWLVKSRRNGYYWLSTKETAFAIFGLTDYLKVSDELSPDFDFEVYLNGQRVLGQHVTDADIAKSQTFVLTRQGREVGPTNQIRVVKHGRGALYLSATLEYFTADEEVPPQTSADLKLTREYFRLNVVQDQGKPIWKIEPLSGELHSGDMIVARLRIEGARADYLMIEDPIPAGCEQVARVDGANLNYTIRDWTDWYSSREYRDEKTVIFKRYFDGNDTFQYAMRVEVPGEFRVAPARAELMYQPTIQANTGNATLRILDKN